MGTVPGDEAAWQRLGKLARERRNGLDLTQAELANRAGVATQTVVRLEAGRKPTRHTGSWSKIERGLEWLPGSVDAILAGGVPIEGTYDGRFLRVQMGNMPTFVHDLVRKITLEIEPNAAVPLANIIRAEEEAERALRAAGLLPPLEDQDPGENNSNK